MHTGERCSKHGPVGLQWRCPQMPTKNIYRRCFGPEFVSERRIWPSSCLSIRVIAVGNGNLRQPTATYGNPLPRSRCANLELHQRLSSLIHKFTDFQYWFNVSFPPYGHCYSMKHGAPSSTTLHSRFGTLAGNSSRDRLVAS